MMSERVGSTLRAGKLVAAFAAGLMVLGGGAGSAGAHGGAGDLDVGEAMVVGHLQIEFPIRVTYQNDGHPHEDLEDLTVSGTGPDGAVVGPFHSFVAGDAPGVYLVTVELPTPGTWELMIGIAEPNATATTTVNLADVAGPTLGASKPPGEPSVAAGVGDEQEPAGGDSGGPWNLQLVVGGMLAGAIIGLLASWKIGKRRLEQYQPGRP